METKNQFIQIEEEALNFWESARIFQKSVERIAPKGDYTFYDGPPFATGTPHYGHIVASLIKDIIPRYQTMRGFKIERKWGWDCHGLPIENIVEKELNLNSKKEIEEKLGVEKFNEHCRAQVLTYTQEWKKTITRFGRWVDMDNAYKTMDLNFMESVWWVFKELWDKGLIYESYRSMHICPRCQTTLSQSEVTEGYKLVKDLSATVKFKLESNQKINNFNIPDNTFILAWTTTPWTLIGNVALAVRKDIDYVLVIKNQKPAEAGDGSLPADCTIVEGKSVKLNFIISNKNNLSSDLSNVETRGVEPPRLNLTDLPSKPAVPTSDLLYQEYFILAKERLNEVIKDNNYEIIQEFKGADLINKSYKPVFDYYIKENINNTAYKIYAGDFVNTVEGTGIVHIAPAFGEDDMRIGKENNLPFIQHIGMDGIIKKEAGDFANLNVKPLENTSGTDIEIIKYLAHHNSLFSKEKYEHSYPHCWRCDTPLLNYTTSSWFVAVEKLKNEALKHAEKINWSPEHIKEGRFGNWLAGARDWSISRQRYWASVIPIWKCQNENCKNLKIIGSVKELENLSGEKINDLHKHVVDKIEFPCEKCNEKMKRIPDVFDCWFESGSMPYAQEHYPFENKEKIDNNFPAQFIAEGADQTRCWFYYLHIISTALKNGPAFQNVIVNGIVQAEDGKKMSKKLKNYPDPNLILEKYGADALRYYLSASPVMLTESLNFSEKGVLEAQRKNIIILWNVYKFYETFISNFKLQTSNFNPNEYKNILDKWVIIKLNKLISEVTDAMESYNLPKATRPIETFIDELSTWYLRRSRERFKSDDENDKNNALQTTGFVLMQLTKIMAPFMPFISETIWQKITGFNFKDSEKSVHLEEWPSQTSNFKLQTSIIENMDLVRKIVELGLAKREEVKIKVKQPLNQLSVISHQLSIPDEYLNLIKDELNIKKVIIINKNDVKDLKVELDLTITPELKQEGLKRELVRLINSLRKDAELTINDQIDLYFSTESQELKEVIEKYKIELQKETLSQTIQNGIIENNKKEFNINNESIILSF